MPKPFESKKILITGASGMLGTSILSEFEKFHSITACYNRNKPKVLSPNIRTVSIDLSNKEQLDSINFESQFDEIIHCAANTKVNECQVNFDQAFNDNVRATLNLIDRFNAKKTRFTYISSDAIYPDLDYPKNEIQTPQPASSYALTKKWGEDVVLAKWLGKSLIFRTTIVGPSTNHFCAWILTESLKNKPIDLYKDVIFSPISTRNLSKKLLKIINSADLSGIFNIGGSPPITKAEFGKQILKFSGNKCPINLINMPSSQASTPRSKNMSLDTTKISNEIGPMPTPTETIKEVLDELKLH